VGHLYIFCYNLGRHRVEYEKLMGVFIVGYIFLYILEFSSVREIIILEKLTNKKLIGVYLGY
jgi:hypothetical protein